LQRKTRRRLHYRQHDEETIRQTIKGAVPVDGIFSDWLLERVCEFVEGDSEFDRGVSEGHRRAFQEILGMAMDDTVKVIEGEK
jgi:hypothetical protein